MTLLELDNPTPSLEDEEIFLKMLGGDFWQMIAYEIKLILK